MPETVVGLGAIRSHLPAEPWLLVFGGVTREGNRRARRAIVTAVQSGMAVVWFDGFAERMAGTETDRVPLGLSAQDGSLVVVDYALDEQDHWLNRIVGGVPASIVGPIERLETGLARQRPRPVPVLTRLRRLLQQLLGTFQKKVLRRLAQIFRGRLGWNLVRDDVTVLAASAPAPNKIIYGDDFALTQAWRATRVWPDAATAMELTLP